MAREEENGHHELMSQMQGMDHSNSREDDFLAGVDAVAASQEAPADPGLPVGQRIRQSRESKGLSLEDLAQRTGLPPEMLAEVENESASPPLGVLVKLGKALDMRWGSLISGGGDSPYTVVRVADRQRMSRQA
ncbi:MAG: helix-turn-helix domain-containing protein, partial [Anaerolineae bacterium]